MNLDLCFTPYTKINSKQINNLDLRDKTIKLLEENIRVDLHELRFGSEFLDMIPKA